MSCCILYALGVDLVNLAPLVDQWRIMLFYTLMLRHLLLFSTLCHSFYNEEFFNAPFLDSTAFLSLDCFECIYCGISVLRLTAGK